MTVPEYADELTPTMFIGLAPLIYQGGDEVACKVKALRVVSGLGVYRWMRLSAEVINRCLPFIDWIFDPKSPLKITRQLIKGYKGLYGPAAGFDNLRMSEFHFAEQHYKEMVEGDDSAIDRLVATLYRKPKPGYNKKMDPDGDIRIAFNVNKVAYYANKIAKWPNKIKQAIFLWYDACRQELITNNPLVFKDRGIDYISQFDTGLYGMMRSLAGNKLGTITDIEQLYVQTAMLEIGLMIEEEKYIESELKKNKKP